MSESTYDQSAFLLDPPSTQAPHSTGLPTPPLRLRRVHLRGVGPEGARFDPLDLDFTTPIGAASRVLLSLTNTGGKSTLITLISSLIVPDSRAQIGRKNLGDYVLTGDTSHVVCEWEDTSTRTRTVTGTVMEWKDGRRQPGPRQRSTTEMYRTWYLFPLLAGQLDIDRLPFLTDDGRRTTHEAFVRGISDLLTERTDMPHVVTRIQHDWTEALEQRTSIDPVLFGYQMRMNDSEAGAEKLLADFDSPDNVVRFFVTALNDDRELTDFTNKLKPYADLAVQRPALEALSAFGEDLAPRIELVAERAEDAERAAEATRRAQTTGGDHCAALDDRIRHDRNSLAELESEARKSALEAATTRREYGQISDIRLQLQLEDARAKLIAARDKVERTQGAAENAQRLSRAWDAVDLIIDVAEARSARDSAQQAYDAADAGLNPLRTSVVAAAAALAGRLDALIAEAGAAATTADEQAKTANDAREKAEQSRRDADTRYGQAIRDLETIDATIAAADQAREDAVTAGWLQDGELIDRCVRRWADERDSAGVRAQEQDRLAAESEVEYDETVRRLDEADRAFSGLHRTADADRDRLTSFTTDLASLAGIPSVTSLAGAEARDADDTVRIVTLAEQAASRADDRAGECEKHARAIREEIAHLDEGGVAPAGADALLVLTALIDAGFGAVTGLRWIEHNVLEADARPAFIDTHPQLAGGVVIADASRFDAALASLEARDLLLRTPVAVVTAPSAASNGDDSGVLTERMGSTPTADSSQTSPSRLHLVLPHRATWDLDWAAARRQQLDNDLTRESGSASAAREAASNYRAAAAACSQFAARWPSVSLTYLEQQAQVSAEALDTAEQEKGKLVAIRDELRAKAHTARATRDTERARSVLAGITFDKASALSKQTGEAASATEQRPLVEDRRSRAQDDAQIADAAKDAAEKLFGRALGQAADARANQGPWSRERNAIGVEISGADPGGNLDVVRLTWTGLRDQLRDAEQGMVEAGALDQASMRLGEVSGRLRRYDALAVEQAEILAGTMEASSPELRSDAQRRARYDAAEAESAFLKAKATQDDAGLTESRARPPDRPNHVDLSNTPEWLPSETEGISSVLARLEIRNSALLTKRDQAERIATEAEGLRALVAADVTAMIDIAALWTLPKSSTIRRFEGTKEAAREQMRLHLTAHREATRVEEAASGKLRDAVTDARGLAGDARWRDLDAPVVVRLRNLRDDELIAEASTLARRVSALTHSVLGDLESMNTHRSLLRDGLISLCREQRRLLREVSRSSRLPEGLGDLSTQPAIKIRFDEAPDDSATARLAVRIDDWAAELAVNPKKASSSEVRTRWLSEAVRDTVVDRPRAGPWTVEILKPRIDGKVMYCPPERIPHEFSGGQVLTLAVLIYCALSGVRSSHRIGGARPPGPLILDNPFGAASAETLIEMQHRLAAHTGLQLVCATGLNDAGVDAAFTGPGSVIVKLRNDGDLRRNLSFLRLRATLVDGVEIPTTIVGGRDPSSAQNWLDATAYEVRR